MGLPHPHPAGCTQGYGSRGRPQPGPDLLNLHFPDLRLCLANSGERGRFLTQPESIPSRGTSRAAASEMLESISAALSPPAPRRQPGRGQAGFGPSGVSHGSQLPSPSKEGAVPSPPAPQNRSSKPLLKTAHASSWRNNGHATGPEAGALPRASLPSSYPFLWERPLSPQTVLPTPETILPTPKLACPAPKPSCPPKNVLSTPKASCQPPKPSCQPQKCPATL